MSTFNIPLESIKKETLEKLLNVVPEGRQIFEPLLVFQKSWMVTF